MPQAHVDRLQSTFEIPVRKPQCQHRARAAALLKKASQKRLGLSNFPPSVLMASTAARAAEGQHGRDMLCTGCGCAASSTAQAVSPSPGTMTLLFTVDCFMPQSSLNCEVRTGHGGLQLQVMLPQACQGGRSHWFNDNTLVFRPAGAYMLPDAHEGAETDAPHAYHTMVTAEHWRATQAVLEARQVRKDQGQRPRECGSPRDARSRLGW